MAKKQLVVIGGGAAGFFCAVNAARLYPNLSVIILEKTSKLLSKVKVSGGGRCNVTHACYSIAEMTRFYPRGASFLKQAFHHFFTTDTITWFAGRGVELKTEADGRMFPVSNSSQTIIDCLLNEVNRHGVEIRVKAEVQEIIINQEKTDSSATKNSQRKFSLQLTNGNTIDADLLCIACGGFPKTEMFSWLKNTGHHFSSPVPSLFTFNMPGNPICSLMGVTVSDVVVKISGSKLQQRGPLLITHWGMSGPAVLKLSAWGARELAEKHYEYNIQINWLPEYNENTLRDKFQSLRFELAPRKIINKNPLGLPAALWEFLLQQCGISEEIRWADLPAKEQNKLIKMLCSHELKVKGKTTFKEEFVTAGGILLSEINAATMESKLVDGLFFAGEILDADGVTGGFNFQHAWTSGWIAAAKGVGRHLESSDSVGNNL